jgi:hypothetical protein
MTDEINTRTIFSEACTEIANLLNDKYFKVLQKGQTLKKISANKDIYYEIYFQSSFRNSALDIIVLPQINIFSNKIKKWKIELSGNPNEQGAVYSNSLGSICPCGYRTWNVAGKSRESEIKHIAELLNNYALPVFNLFENIETAIDFLKVKGTHFNKHTKNSIMPLDFMIYYATKEESELFLNNFISTCSYKARIISLYKELETCKDINLNYSEFSGADRVKLAFINDLKIFPKT